jgi:hypothetical protein
LWESKAGFLVKGSSELALSQGVLRTPNKIQKQKEKPPDGGTQIPLSLFRITAAALD